MLMPVRYRDHEAVRMRGGRRRAIGGMVTANITEALALIATGRERQPRLPRMTTNVVHAHWIDPDVWSQVCVVCQRAYYATTELKLGACQMCYQRHGERLRREERERQAEPARSAFDVPIGDGYVLRYTPVRTP